MATRLAIRVIACFLLLGVAWAQELQVGQELEVEWRGRWYEAVVLEVHEAGRVKVHFKGFPKKWDEVVGPARIRVAGAAPPGKTARPAKQPRPGKQTKPAKQTKRARPALSAPAAKLAARVDELEAEFARAGELESPRERQDRYRELSLELMDHAKRSRSARDLHERVEAALAAEERAAKERQDRERAEAASQARRRSKQRKRRVMGAAGLACLLGCLALALVTLTRPRPVGEHVRLQRSRLPSLVFGFWFLAGLGCVGVGFAQRGDAQLIFLGLGGGLVLLAGLVLAFRRARAPLFADEEGLKFVLGRKRLWQDFQRREDEHFEVSLRSRGGKRIASRDTKTLLRFQRGEVKLVHSLIPNAREFLAFVERKTVAAG